VVEAKAKALTLFSDLKAAGLGGPSFAAYCQQGGPKVTKLDDGFLLDGREMSEPWLLFWFSESVGWDKITFSNDAECPVFDVPFLVVLQRRPSSVRLEEDGVRITFPGECGDCALMPLYGIERLPHAVTRKWADGLPDEVAAQCRFWARVARRLPVSVTEAYAIDTARDRVTLRESFQYRRSDDDWGTEPLLVAPVQPVVALASEKGFPITFPKEPVDCLSPTSVGPYHAILDEDEYVFHVDGLLKYITDTRIDRKKYGGKMRFRPLWRNYWWACHEAYTILGWGKQMPYASPLDREHARNAMRVLARFMLNPDNVHYTYDERRQYLHVHDGMNWNRLGWVDSNAVSGEHLRAFYYLAHYGGLWDIIKRNWPHMRGLHHVLADWTTWNTSAFNSGGGDTFDSTFNAHIFVARMAAKLGEEADCRNACYLAVKKMIAAYACVQAVPDYVGSHRPWVGELLRAKMKEKAKEFFYTDIYRGNQGFMPWNRAITHRPSEAEYHFAHDYLKDYLTRRFSKGRGKNLGESAAAWDSAEYRKEYGLPKTRPTRFWPGIDPYGRNRGNFIYHDDDRDYYWPRIFWAGYKTPQLERLDFGGVCPDPKRLPLNKHRGAANWVLSLSRSTISEEIEGIDSLRTLPQELQRYVIENGRHDIAGYVKLFEEQASQEWLVIGPFSMPNCDKFEESLPPEANVDLEATYDTNVSGKSYVASWQKQRCGNHRLDFNTFYEPNLGRIVHNSAVYALGHIDSPDTRSVKFCIGSDDGVRVWLNGALIHSHHIHRGAKFDQDIVPVTLKKGRNKVLVKVTNRRYGAGWILVFRVADDKMLPFRDLGLGL